MFRIALTAADADEVGTSSSAAGGPTASNLISPRPSNPLPSTTSATTLPGVTSASSARNPRIRHTRGVLHLYRSSSSRPASSYAVAATPSSSSSGPAAPPLPCNSILPSWRSTRLLVLAVPTRVLPDDFVDFCCTYVEHISEIRIIRYDGVEDRYSILVEFDDQMCADSFYMELNGMRFSSSEMVCHVLFIAAVQDTSSAEIAVLPAGFTELPTCPVCIERLDQDISGIVATSCDHRFQCSCVSMWVSSSCPVCQFCRKQSKTTTTITTCSVCSTTEDLWICVVCGSSGCGRYIKGHSIRHWKGTQHCYSLDLKTQRVWDYIGENYVHRLNHSKSDAKHAKFGSERDYSGDNCVKCLCKEDSDMDGVMCSKTDIIVDKYKHFLASQLEIQTEYYKARLSDAKKEREQRISVAVDNAINVKLQEMQLKLENTMLEKEKVTEMNEKLTKTQDIWCRTVKGIEERERAQLRLKDDTIADLEVQIKDFEYSIKLQKSIRKSPHADDLKGGTLVPLAMESDSGKGKILSKSKRKKRYP